MAQGGLKNQVVYRLEGGDLPIPRHDQRQCGRLDAAKGEDALTTGLAPPDAQGAGGVQADEPVCLGAGAGRVPQVGVLLIVLQGIKRRAHGAGIKGSQPDTPDGALVAEAFQHFVNQKLTFPVGVTRVDHAFRFLEQGFYGLKLLLGLEARLEFPCRGNHRQRIPAPIFPLGVVILGIALFEQMPITPCYCILSANIVCGEASVFSESFGDGLCQRRFFGNEETLDHGFLSIQKVAIGSEAAFEGVQQGREQTFFQFIGLKVGGEALPAVIFNA